MLNPMTGFSGTVGQKLMRGGSEMNERLVHRDNDVYNWKHLLIKEQFFIEHITMG